MKRKLSYRSRIEASNKEVFTWHTLPGAIERLSPPWEKIEVLASTQGVKDGCRVVLKTYIGPVPIIWVVEHRDYVEGKQFRDVQLKGPFKRWDHTHLVKPVDAETCFLEDIINYEIPLGSLAEFLGDNYLKDKLETLFDYRHSTIDNDITLHKKYGAKAMKILVSGSTGLIGSALIHFLTTGGHTVTRLVRDGDLESGNMVWDPANKKLESTKLEGYDAIIHLSGENVSGRWTDEKKSNIEKSRVNSTKFLCSTISKLKKKPKVLVCASAIGYYGDRGGEILTEESDPGTGFLTEVVKKWESATEAVSKAGIRVINLRFGLVLSPKGGALEKMLLPFRLGLGGKLGSGDQYISWISIDDAIGAIYHAISTDSLTGPVNIVSPNPVTNFEFTKVLGKVLGRPTIFSVPSLLLKSLFGEMANETVLASTRVEPSKLLSTGYQFNYARLENALNHLLGRPKN